MHFVLDIVTANGRPMRFLYLPAGEAGPQPARVPEGHPHPLVEVYDRTHRFNGEHGHFTGRYYAAEDLRDHTPGAGLALVFDSFAEDISKHNWFVDAAVMNLVAAWLRSLLSRSTGVAAAAATE